MVSLMSLEGGVGVDVTDDIGQAAAKPLKLEAPEGNQRPSENPATGHMRVFTSASGVELGDEGRIRPIHPQPAPSDRQHRSVQTPPLDELLKRALHICPYKENSTFLPIDELAKVMKAEHVEDYLVHHEREELRANCSQIMEHVCGQPGQSNTRGTSCRIFAILVLIEMPSKILDVIKENLSDKDLPFHREIGSQDRHLAKNTDGGLVRIHAFSGWTYSQRNTLYQDQWRVQAPVFLKGSRSLNEHPVHRLHKKAIFPWTKYERVYDGNSEVVRVNIHKAHSRLGSGVGDPSWAPQYFIISADKEYFTGSG